MQRPAPRARFNPIGKAMVCAGLGLCLALAPSAFASGTKIISSNRYVLGLNGAWEFRQAGQTDWRPAEVPGTVHQDLLRNGLIPDPFYRDNELKVQWVENADWEYRTKFDVVPVIAGKSHIDLVFDGLDTFAAVFVNGQKVAETDNMFRLWRFDVKPLIKAGSNEVRIVFDSPVRREKMLEQKLSYKVPGEAPHARKAPYSFGWDWGPRLATSGIWRAVSLEAWDQARITDLDIQQDFSKKGEVTLKVTTEVLADRALKADLQVSLDGGKPSVTLPLTMPKGTSRHQALVKIKNPKLWWPAGMGEQNLYVVHAGLLQGGYLVGHVARRIGLRTMELVQDKDAWGHSFYFRVNGVPFFAKGGNWIPADSFLPRVSRDRYEQLLKSCQNAFMNMLRVWGGGAYESEDFYDLCDELGLVVWQEFMFACQMVPGDAAFQDNVRAEAEDVIRSLRHHASIALWCGNNECEEGWFFWGWKDTLPPTVWDDYQKIFEGILPQAVQKFDPGRPYWPSSPHTLNKTGDPRSEESGDMHYWGVWHGQEPFEVYQKHNHRFYSEFGFQSFPLLESVKTYALPEDWNIASPVMEQHQKNTEGNRLIMLYMLDWFRLPKDFESLLWTSQVLQAEGMKIAVEHYRSQMPRIMGALYWQIEDCWPVASWAGLDYSGTWKALQYYARRFYNPMLITAIPRGDKLVVNAVSDHRGAKSAEFRWSVRTYGGEVIAEKTQAVSVEPGTSTVLLEAPLEELKKGRSEDEIYFACELVNGDKVYSSNIYHFSRLKRVNLPDPQITTSVTVDCCAPVVELRSKNFAKDVTLAAPGCPGRFEDNFFDMLPGRVYKVRFLPAEGANLDLLKSKLRLRSLKDSY
jgi:beta-mannosidase